MQKHFILELFDFNKKIRFLSLFLLLIGIFFVFDVKSAAAHRPHDVVSQVEISPDYNRNKTLFIIVRNNLFKSKNGGQNWTRIVRGLDNQFNLSNLVISPKNSQILYISSSEDGIYKSEDEGESWNKLDLGLDKFNIDLLAVSRSDPDWVLAAEAEKGLYQTKDGGKTWSTVKINNTKTTAIAFSPQKPELAAVGDNLGNISLSNDGGATWQLQGTIEEAGKINAIAFSPTSESTLFVGTEKKGIFQTPDLGSSFAAINQKNLDKNIRDIVISGNSPTDSWLWVSTWDKGVFLSKDGGKQWENVSNGLTKDSQADDLKSPHFDDLEISPNFEQDKTLFVGGFDGLFQSTDGAKNWSELETLAKGTITSLSVSPSYESDSTLAFVTYVGNIYRSNDKGVTWSPINKGLEVPRFTNDFEEPHQDPRRFFDIAFARSSEDNSNLFATILWDYFLKFSNRDSAWDIVSVPKVRGYATRGMTIVPSPNFPSDRTVYVATQYGVVYRSTDGGETLSESGKVGNRSTNEALSLAISPNFSADKTLYASGPQGVHKSVDGGRTWQPITAGKPLMERSNIQVAISPNYAADKTVVVGSDRGVFLSQDEGKTWSQLEGTAYGKEAYIEGIAISPDYQNDRTFLVSVRGQGLFKTTDSGQNFTKIGNDAISLSRMNTVPSAGIPIQFSPAYASDKTIYGFGSATTEVYKSTDGGNTWETLAVPKNEDESHDLMTSIALFFHVYRSRLLRIGAALVAAILTYLVLSFLKVEKRLPWGKAYLKAVASAVVFIIAAIVLLR